MKARDAIYEKCFVLYQKIKQQMKNIPQKAGRFHIRWMDVMMKILLPAGFVTLKLTGTFIDFLLGLSNSNTQEVTAIKTAKVRDSFGLTAYETLFMTHKLTALSWNANMNPVKQLSKSYSIFMKIQLLSNQQFQKALIH